MKKISLLFIFLNIIICNAKAEIAYIDINFILNQSNVGKFLNNHIENSKKINLAKYKKIEDELIKKEKSLVDQQNILSKDQFQERLKILTKQVQEYRSEKKATLEKLNKFRIDKTKEIFDILNPIITQYVDTNSISIVMPKKNIVVGKKNLDITNQILELLNTNVNKLEF